MDWDNPLNAVVTTVDEVASGGRPVLLVQHDEGHGGWQFYDGFDVSKRFPTFIPKDAMLAMDPTLSAVIDLPVGWQARRTAIGGEWIRESYTPS